jgi:hypothetical protein
MATSASGEAGACAVDGRGLRRLGNLVPVLEATG